MPEPQSPTETAPTRSFDPALPTTLAADPSAVASALAAAVPGYELLAEIGRGGMGVVYQAKQTAANRIVALKMITSGGFATEAQRQRFRAEAEAVALLDHPGIVPIYEIGEAGGGPFFSMKFVAGRTLREAIADPNWAPDLRDRVAVLAKIVRAVHHAHQRGVIHRDIKPANVLLDEAGEPHVMDFGLAKRLEGKESLTHSGAIFGTPAYMPPEQAGGDSKNVTTLADVYSLGALLYELLVGRPPFVGDGPFAIAQKVLLQPPDPPSQIRPDVDRDLEAVCQKCLAKAPDERYGSAADLADDLDRWIRREPLSVRPPGLAFLIWRWLQQNVRTTIRIVLIGFGCSFVGGGIVALAALLSVFVNASRVMDRFPSAEKPWLLRVDWAGIQKLYQLPLVAPLSLLLASVLLGGMGLFGVWAARTRNRWDDLSVGLGLGFVSGQTLLFCGVMQSVLLTYVIVPYIQDYTFVSHGCFVRDWPPPGELDDPNAPPSEHPADRLTAAHPDLRAAKDERDRSGMFVTWIVANQVVGVFLAVWIAGLFCWIAATFTCVCQVMLAGHLFRKHQTIGRVWTRYAILSLFAYPFLAALVLIGSGNDADDLLNWSVALFGLAAVAFVWLGFRWQSPPGIILAGMGYLALGNFVAEGPVFAPFGLGYTALHLALGFAAAYLWRRRQLRAGIDSQAPQEVSA